MDAQERCLLLAEKACEEKLVDEKFCTPGYFVQSCGAAQSKQSDCFSWCPAELSKICTVKDFENAVNFIKRVNEQ